MGVEGDLTSLWSRSNTHRRNSIEAAATRDEIQRRVTSEYGNLSRDQSESGSNEGRQWHHDQIIEVKEQRYGGILNPLIPHTGSHDVFSKHPVVDEDVPLDIKTTTAQETRLILDALKLNDPYVLLDTLLHRVRDKGAPALSNLPPTTFSEILRRLDPHIFVKRYDELYNEFEPKHFNSFGLAKDPSGFHRFSLVILSQVDSIVKARHDIYGPSLIEYKYLLKCAKASRNTIYAQIIWDEMKKHSVVPDIQCYNDYLSAKSWTELSNTFQKKHLRVIPIHIRQREREQQRIGLQGHLAKSKHHAGHLYMVSEVFKELVASGLRGSEETFCLMIVGLAREAELKGIASILKRVWGVEVGMLMGDGEEEPPPVKSYRYDSPLYPSEELLFTLAHAYAINNSIATALRIIDFVSTQYNIPISNRVWNELIHYSYVLSRHRARRFDEETGEEVMTTAGRRTGQLSKEALSALWATMTSPPYNARPTLQMYFPFFKNLVKRSRFGEAERLMDQAVKLHRESEHNFARKLSVAKRSRLSCRRHGYEWRFRDPVYESQKRDLAFAYLRLQRDVLYFQNMAKYWLFYSTKNGGFKHRLGKEAIPTFVRKWSRFLPKNAAAYRVAQGSVVFNSSVKRFNREVWDRSFKRRHFKDGYMRHRT
ncbi:mitochondrial ATPase expression-domain-containing protein [Bisporella sp. PMI_857]|nr:mitochondrial ATPase expression-domain-containing protein [Bisporella sp. PMI_857]